MDEKVRVKGPDGKVGFIPKAQLRMALDRGFALQDDAPSLPSAPTESVLPTTIPGKISGLVQRAIKPFSDVTLPLTNPVSQRLEETGKRVNQSVQGSADEFAYAGFPTLATATSMIGDMGELTPSNLSIAVGSEALPVVAAPLARRADLLRRSVGNKFIGTPLKSLKRSIREGGETLGERFLNTELPANREEAFAEASNIVDDLEDAIQERLAASTKKARATDLPTAETKGVSQGVLSEPMVLPSTGKVPKYGEPKVGTIPRWLEPDEQGLLTAGKKGVKGGNKGVFDPGDPFSGPVFDDKGNVIKEGSDDWKQLQYIKQSVADNVQKIKQEFASRKDSPEYGYGLKSKFSIGKEEIGKAFDGVIQKMGKTGTEPDSVNMLKELKASFLEAHPGHADVQYWNGIKREIHRLVGDNGYLTQNSSAKISALKSVASQIKRRIEDIVPGIKELNREQGGFLEMRDSLGDLIASRSRNNVGGIIKSELQDEALVRSARNKVGQKLYKTRGLSGISLPLLDREE